MSIRRQVIGAMIISIPTAHGTHPIGRATTGAGTPAGTGVHGMTPTGHGTGDGNPDGDRLGHGALHGVRHGHGGLHGVRHGDGGPRGVVDDHTIHATRERSAICPMDPELRQQAYGLESPTAIMALPTVISLSTDHQQTVVPVFQPDPA